MKKLFAILVIAILAIGCVGMLVACENQPEEKIDYATATYAKLKEVNWNEKTVTYQFLNDRLDGYGAYWPICLNLYSDGSAAAWQATVTGFHVTHFADKDHYILWDFYGSWTETDGVITVSLKGEGFTVKSDFGEKITPTELVYKDIKLADGKGSIADFACIASVGADIKGLVESDGTVHYKTFSDFFNSYKDEYSEEQ